MCIACILPFNYLGTFGGFVMKKITALVVCLKMLVFLTNESVMASDITIGYSLKSVQEERWQRELDGCIAVTDELGAEFVYFVANGDSQQQISQIKTMISQGVDVIMITAVDAGALMSVIDEAKEEGIKILIFDQQLQNSYGDVFVGYDDFDNGAIIASPLQALNIAGNIVLLHGDKASGMDELINGEKSVLAELDVNIAMELYCQNWAEENAFSCAKKALAEMGSDISAFICMNDGIASGAVQALKEYGMTGKVVVTGMDSELTALQRIVKGTQTSTVYKDSSILSKIAIETAMALAKGEEITANQTVNFGKNDMPHVVVKSTVITKDNIDEKMIDTGYYLHKEIYGE